MEDSIDCLRLIHQATILNFELPRFLTFTAGTTPGIVPIVLDKALSSLPGGGRETLCPKLKFPESTSRLSFLDKDLQRFIVEKQQGVSLDVLKLQRLRIIFL